MLNLNLFSLLWTWKNDDVLVLRTTLFLCQEWSLLSSFLSLLSQKSEPEPNLLSCLCTLSALNWNSACLGTLSALNWNCASCPFSSCCWHSSLIWQLLDWTIPWRGSRKAEDQLGLRCGIVVAPVKAEAELCCRCGMVAGPAKAEAELCLRWEEGGGAREGRGRALPQMREGRGDFP